MKIIDKLIKSDGEFTLEDINKHMKGYERAVDTLLKINNRPLVDKILSCYFNLFSKREKEVILSYTPGMDYKCSYRLLYMFALNSKHINKDDRDHAYLLLLKRFDMLPRFIQKGVIDKKHLLLRYAYPDANDRYPLSLLVIGDHLFSEKKYKEAYRCYKKVASFKIEDRQISYPYHLHAISQNYIGDMYRDGLGVRKNIVLAKRYYSMSAHNDGRSYHPKVGDIELNNGHYSKAFLCYTDNNPYQRYRSSYMEIDNLEDKFNKIYQGIINKENKTKLDKSVLAMMYKLGIACKQSDTLYDYYLPHDASWVDSWIENMSEFITEHLYMY